MAWLAVLVVGWPNEGQGKGVGKGHPSLFASSPSCRGFQYKVDSGATCGHRPFAIPERGFYSDNPAVQWEDALLSGNGTMGIMVMGKPYDETVIVNHSWLYLPNEVPDTYVDQAKRLPHIREMLMDGDYKGACDEVTRMRKECGYEVQRDPFITGFDVRIARPGEKIVRYRRGVDYSTAEVFSEWEDSEGYTVQRAFVSRKDSVMALVIEGDHKISCTLSFEKRNQRDSQGELIVPEGFSDMESGYADGWLTFRASYLHANPYNPFGGYEGVGKAQVEGGRQYVAGNKLVIEDADRVTLWVKVAPYTRSSGNIMQELKKAVLSVGDSYDELLVRNAAVHGALFNPVRLTLEATESERVLSSEEFVAQAVEGRYTPAWTEKVFDAGRYNIICSTGSNPPNLQGLWSGTWSAAWFGSFTTNGNLPTAISFLLSGNTPELMRAYFDQIHRLMEGFRASQRALFGMRGFHIPAQMTMSPMMTDATRAYPHCYWTAGAGWAAWQFYDYYRYTGDEVFLRREAYPLMKEAAAFYEDFLTMEDGRGRYIFAPSYSPENAPGGEQLNPAAVNATMDVMVAKQLLRSCVDAARVLKCDKALVGKWREMLAKMPDYEVTPDGYLREWLWKDLPESNAHRHVSHLYALYDEVAPEFKTDVRLCNAVKRTLDARMEMRRKHRGWVMAFGMAQAGLAAAHIGDVQHATECIDLLSRYYWTKGMASLHNPGNCFNMDISGGLPYLISQTLAYSEPGYLNVLPAVPEAWKSGRIEGLLLRGNVVLKSLEWNPGEVRVTLWSSHAGTVKVDFGGRLRTVKLQKDEDVTCCIPLEMASK